MELGRNRSPDLAPVPCRAPLRFAFYVLVPLRAPCAFAVHVSVLLPSSSSFRQIPDGVGGPPPRAISAALPGTRAVTARRATGALYAPLKGRRPRLKGCP